MNVKRLACTAVTLVVLATACGNGDGDGENVGTDPTTPTVPTTPPTTAPVDQPQPEDAVAWFDGIWPDSRAALERERVEFDAGQRPGRDDPVATAAAFLRSVGIEEPVMGSYDQAGGRSSVVRYESGPAAGFVFLRRVEGNPLPYVVRLESPRFDVVQTERTGGSVRVEVASVIPGTIVARAGSLGSEWQDEQEAPILQGPPVTLTLAIDSPREPVLLEVRHQGEDGFVAVARLRVQPVAPSRPAASSGAPLSTDSQLRIGGFGPIEVGMTLDQALAAAGVPMTISGSRYCETLTAPEGPEFVRFVSTGESEGRITAISVMSDSVATEEGIGYGSTEAEVRAAYTTGEFERFGSDDAHRLVHVPAGNADHALVFLVVNSRVIQMETGVTDLMRAQEYCS